MGHKQILLQSGVIYTYSWKNKITLHFFTKNFIKSYKEDDLIKSLIEDVKPSMTGHHSPLYKAINF